MYTTYEEAEEEFKSIKDQKGASVSKKLENRNFFRFKKHEDPHKLSRKLTDSKWSVKQEDINHLPNYNNDEDNGENNDNEELDNQKKKKKNFLFNKNKSSNFWIPPNKKVIGLPIQSNRLIQRNLIVGQSMESLTQLIDEEIYNAKKKVNVNIISDYNDRVNVTNEISSAMNLVRTSKDLEERNLKYRLSSEKVLNFRNCALIMMNSNYNGVEVRRIEPINLNESRAIQAFKK